MENLEILSVVQFAVRWAMCPLIKVPRIGYLKSNQHKYKHKGYERVLCIACNDELLERILQRIIRSSSTQKIQKFRNLGGLHSATPSNQTVNLFVIIIHKYYRSSFQLQTIF